MLKSALAALLILGSAGVALVDDSWVGTWKINWNGAIDTTLVVQSVNGATVKAKYSWAKTGFGPAGSRSVTAKVSGKKLSWSGNGISFVFTQKGNTLSAVRTTSTGSAHGTFRKVN
jgi:hypothetical protein